jgi:ribosomal protein S18 acetylase RimI-like enzyme
VEEPADGTIVAARSPTGKPRRLATACGVEFARFDPVRGAEWVASVDARCDRGEVRTGRWADPSGGSGGCVAWESIPNVGRRLVLWFLDERHRSRASLASLFRVFEAFEPLDGPVFYAPDALPGISLEDQAAVLEPAGMVHLDRERVVFPREAEVPGAPLGAHWVLRREEPADRPALFELAWRAYSDYPGQLEWRYVDLEKDLREYFDFLRNPTTPVLPEATFVALVHGQVRGNVIARRGASGPYIDSLSVDPRFQGRGIGRALMVRALEALRSGGPAEEVRLNYLRQNPRAAALYRSLGFRPDAVSRDLRSGYWVRRKTLQVVLARPENAKYR